MKIILLNIIRFREVLYSIINRRRDVIKGLLRNEILEFTYYKLINNIFLKVFLCFCQIESNES